MIPLLDSTALLADPAALLEPLRRDGYLFVRGVVPPEELTRARSAIAAELEAARLLRDPSGEDLTVNPEARAAACADAGTMFSRVFPLEPVHRLAHLPGLIRLMSCLLGNPLLVHPRPFIRIILPTSSGRVDTTTAAHQDYVSQQGSEETLTAWIPLHSVALMRGPLTVVAASHHAGVLPFRLGTQPGSLEVAEAFEGSWHASPLEAGDLIVFHSLMVHRALPNTTRCIRLSVDVRYQRATDPVNPQCLELGGLPYSWDNVYAGWTGATPRYYWRSLPLSFRAFDPRFHRERDELALRLAEAADPRAIPELHRLRRCNDAALRERASVLLERLLDTYPADESLRGN